MLKKVKSHLQKLFIVFHYLKHSPFHFHLHRFECPKTLVYKSNLFTHNVE